MAEETREFETDSFVCYHVCWMLVIGEQLVCEREERNPSDRYAVAVKKVVTSYIGHGPRNISTLCSLFIRRGGTMLCVVSGRRRYSRKIFNGKTFAVSKIHKNHKVFPLE